MPRCPSQVRSNRCKAGGFAESDVGVAGYGQHSQEEEAMNPSNTTMSVWKRMSKIPGGKWAFSRLVCWKAPYFSSIAPLFTELRPGYCEVYMAKRRNVLNHIGTVHAIAMCNMVELAGGTLTEITIPPSHRWIPKEMKVTYLRKAETDLRAVAAIESAPAFGVATEFPVSVNIIDTNDETVLRAVIAMWVSPKKQQ